MEGTSPEEEEATEPEEEPTPVAGYTMKDAMAEFAGARAAEMAQQQAILESIQDEAYVEAYRQFIR